MTDSGKAQGRVVPLLHDGEGFSTVGVAIAILISLALIFTGAQVYQVQSASAEVQEVADAAALAADNVVAEYYLAARLCDAVVLSLTLAGTIALGMGVAALCTPVTAGAASALIEAGTKLLRARDAFAQKAAEGLDRLQKALPFLGAAAAVRVTAANRGSMGTSFVGVAVLVPLQGKDVEVGAAGAAERLIGAVDENKDALGEAGEQAEDAAQRALDAKGRAYQADCGANPDYCMYQRAATLAGMHGADNPWFGSAETWSFSAAMNRAKAYYPRRLAQESPQGGSVEEQARSSLRKRFYRYAVSEIRKGYVHETDSSFEAYFPLLPRNTHEMRGTRLYTEHVYPITVSEEGIYQMHAFYGCPNAGGSVGTGSIAQLDGGGFETCPACGFTVSSMGNVAAASTNTSNGFEHYYRIVAEEARTYEHARNEYFGVAEQVKERAQSLFDEALEALRGMASQRITVGPPGRSGTVAIVACLDSRPASTGFASRFVPGGGTLGAHVAISAATLVSDSPEQGRTVISSLLDGVREQTGSHLVGVLDGVMDLWSAVLYAYADGQQRIGQGLDELDSKLSFGSASGLGLWSSKKFDSMMEELGLQPVEMDAPKPVLVNSGNVLPADTSGFGARLMSVKRVAANLSGADPLSGAVSAAERWISSGIEAVDDEIVVAEVEILGEGGPKVPVTIAVPESLRQDSLGLVSSIADYLRGVAGSITGVRQWR